MFYKYVDENQLWVKSLITAIIFKSRLFSWRESLCPEHITGIIWLENLIQICNRIFMKNWGLVSVDRFKYCFAPYPQPYVFFSVRGGPTCRMWGWSQEWGGVSPGPTCSAINIFIMLTRSIVKRNCACGLTVC